MSKVSINPIQAIDDLLWYDSTFMYTAALKYGRIINRMHINEARQFARLHPWAVDPFTVLRLQDASWGQA